MGRAVTQIRAVTPATAKTPLQITCPRRTPEPPAITAKTPQNGLEITAATCAGCRRRTDCAVGSEAMPTGRRDNMMGIHEAVPGPRGGALRPPAAHPVCGCPRVPPHL